MRRRATVALAGILVSVLAGALGRPSPAASDASVRSGGTFRVKMMVDSLDPALSYSLAGWALLDTTCARLMTYPDRPPPAGFRVVPEVARSYRASRDGKTHTFTLRSGFRFSDGRPVRASAFARAINRTLVPAMESPGAQYTRDIVGAEEVLAGRRPTARGVVARGDRLVIRLTRPVRDLPAQMTMPFFCAVPPDLPADPEGRAAFPAAGPYHVAEYVRGQRAVLRRNRFYRGTRPQHVDRFEVDLRRTTSAEIVAAIDRGTADWGPLEPPTAFDPAHRLVARFGINRSRFFVKPGLTFRGFVLNTSRPLFRNNPRLRRAVNFAIDRRAIVSIANSGNLRAAHRTGQYLPPSIPGFRNASIYPTSRPDVRRARALARRHTRGGKAVLYTSNAPVPVAHAQSVKNDLAKIGLDVEITALPGPAFGARLSNPGEPYDIAGIGWGPDYVDPYAYLNVLLDGRFVRANNWSRFNSARYNRLLRRAARLRGSARYRAYGELGRRLARDAAPMVAIAFSNDVTFVSRRVGCVVLRRGLDLTAACLK